MFNFILGFLNLGGSEVFFIVVIILLLFGSKSIPDLARGLGKGVREFKDATNGLKQEFERTMNEEPPKPAASTATTTTPGTVTTSTTPVEVPTEQPPVSSTENKPIVETPKPEEPKI